MKHYRVSSDSDLYAISLVEEPAIEAQFIALSKAPEVIKLQEDKKIIVGPALIPNKPIYRNVNGNEFIISFDKATIEILAQNFLAKHYQHNVTLAHSTVVDDVVVVESWIKTSDSDKSIAYGLDEPIGTWFISMKVNNDEIWKDIKDGVYKGFSIEAIVGLDEDILNSYNVNMEKDLLEKLKEIIYEALGKTPNAEEVIKETVEEIIEKPEIKMEVQEEEVAKLKEDVANLVAEVERLKSERDNLESRLQDLEAEKLKMNEEMEAVKAENVKLSKQPSVEPVKNVTVASGPNYSAAVKFQLK